MKTRSISICLVALFFAISSTAFALDWIEGYKLEPYWAKSNSPLIIQYDNGLILDLAKNIVVSRGESPIYGFGQKTKELTENTAIKGSVNEMIKTMGQLRFNTEQRLYNVGSASPEFSALITQKIKGSINVMYARILTMNGTVRVTSSIKYQGPNSLLSSIYLYFLKSGSSSEVNEISAFDEPSGEENLVAKPLKAHNIDIKGTYTGLIVDARGLKVEPAIDPLIIDMDGNTVYGSISSLDLSLLQKVGKLEYFDSLKEAQSDLRVGKNPLVVKAGEAKRNCDIVLSGEDGYRVIKENEQTGFLNKLNVIVVI